MCGICGIVPKTGISPENLSGVKAMASLLKHRGPDSEGYFNDVKVALGIRRLSIIDLDTGSQPLYNEDKSIVIICNGEIYNYIELREELKSKGHHFSTGSDCETVIHAYEEYGDNFLNHLRGMFGLCLYDTKKERVIVARDRMGEKPIYLYKTTESIAFSSELKSLLAIVPKNAREVDKDSLYLYFHYGYIPGSRTMFKSVSKLLPAHMVVIDIKDNSFVDTVYWDKSDIKSENKDMQEAETLRKELGDIEKIIIRSDVPVGISLSGGIDSSLIASLATKYSKNKLHAFSVGYPGYPENDERGAAEKLSRELGLTFHSIEVSEDTFAKDFPSLVEAMDDPISDIAAYGYYAVSKEARKAGVPVLLAGFGGDELFWGYRWAREATRINDLKANPFGKILALGSLIKWFWRDLKKKPVRTVSLVLRMAFSGKVILYELTPQWNHISQNGGRIFNPAFLSSIDRTHPFKAEEKPLRHDNGQNITDLLSDIWLVSNCIDLGDRMSMAHSVELRLPLVDYKLYEKVVGIRNEHPRDYQLGYKHWLIRTAEDILPKYILKAKKRGFTPPTHAWVQRALMNNKETLLDGYLVSHNIMNKSFIEKALAEPTKNVKFLYSVLVLEIWARKYL